MKIGGLFCFPTRGVEQISKDLGYGFRGFQIPPQFWKFGEPNFDWIFAVEIRREPIGRCFFLLLETTEHPIPNDQNTRVVFVEIFLITSMMYPMVRGGI